MSARLKELSGDQQRAGIAAAALFFTLLLPWYSQSRVIDGRIESERLSAFRVFSFVEAAVLLSAAAVLYLLHARSQRRAFHLPGGDGWAITLAEYNQHTQVRILQRALRLELGPPVEVFSNNPKLRDLRLFEQD